MRLVVKVVAALVLAVVVYLAFTFGQVWLAARRDEARPADVIVVLGAAQYNGRPSAVLRARLDHAAALYREKRAGTIWVTGGGQPGDRVTEATASADYLHSLHVPDVNIKREVEGRTSWQSLAAVAVFLRSAHQTHVLLVSDPFHSFRIKAIASELGLQGLASPTRTSPIVGLSEVKYMGRETVAVAVGRIIGFRREAGVHAVVANG